MAKKIPDYIKKLSDNDIYDYHIMSEIIENASLEDLMDDDSFVSKIYNEFCDRFLEN